MEERLHKVLAAAGVASRREAERLIAAGQVAVDGETVTEMGVKVDPAEHQITVAGRPVAIPERKTYVLLNKPGGYVTTRSDPHAGRTVMDLLRDVDTPVHPIGRLDKDTEGVLILTNDGELTQLLTHPSHGVPKVYQARVAGVPGEKALEALRTGVRLEEGVTAPAHVRVLHAEEDRSVLEITLHEGRKRQVRRMLDAVGHPVRHLRRVAVGPISVRKLPLGAWRYLTQKEVHALIKAARGEAPKPAVTRDGGEGRVRAGRDTRRGRAAGPAREVRGTAAREPIRTESGERQGQAKGSAGRPRRLSAAGTPSPEPVTRPSPSTQSAKKPTPRRREQKPDGKPRDARNP